MRSPAKRVARKVGFQRALAAARHSQENAMHIHLRDCCSPDPLPHDRTVKTAPRRNGNPGMLKRRAKENVYGV